MKNEQILLKRKNEIMQIHTMMVGFRGAVWGYASSSGVERVLKKNNNHTQLKVPLLTQKCSASRVKVPIVSITQIMSKNERF